MDKCWCFMTRSSRLRHRRLKQPGSMRSAKSWPSSSKPTEVFWTQPNPACWLFFRLPVCNCSYLYFRSKSAEELGLCFPESHQQRLHLPQVSVHAAKYLTRRCWDECFCVVMFAAAPSPVHFVATDRRPRKNRKRRSPSWARSPKSTPLLHPNTKVI